MIWDFYRFGFETIGLEGRSAGWSNMFETADMYRDGISGACT